jgi:metal-responsive CopG/Arc/MetJ family transcriptional regulator
MGTVTVNISFKDSLLAEIDQTANQESRSRSELLREAARIYIKRNNRWNQIFRLTETRGGSETISERDVLNEIRSYRREKKATK